LAVLANANGRAPFGGAWECQLAVEGGRWPTTTAWPGAPAASKRLVEDDVDVSGIYPNDQGLIRLAGSLLIEQNDEWLVHSQEPLAALHRGSASAGSEADHHP
jgi:hypothetical protein